MAPSKVWLVTGASSGLGLAISVSALGAGHKVLACARTPEKAAKDHPEVESLGGKWLRLDVTSADVQQIVQTAVEEEGRIDVLVNNAGYAAIGSLEDSTSVYPLRLKPYRPAAPPGALAFNIGSSCGLT